MGARFTNNATGESDNNVDPDFQPDTVLLSRRMELLVAVVAWLMAAIIKNFFSIDAFPFMHHKKSHWYYLLFQG